MPRRVDAILEEWRQLEHELEYIDELERFTGEPWNPYLTDGLAARVDELRQQHAQATGKAPAEDETPRQLRLPF